MSDNNSGETKGIQNMQSESPNIPAFLGKLWKMVNDPSTDSLICWSSHGNSFIIQNQAQFWYELLPVYYKHNNMSSFVRQLNMYGFHKISTIENGAMDAMEKDEIQFYHPYFQRDQLELLKMIKRKATTRPHESSNSNLKGDDLTKVLIDVKQLRGRQRSVDSQLSAMKQENVVLWRELALLRQKHLKQQQIVNKLIQFLVTLVQPPSTTRMGVGVKRRMPLMLHESPNRKAKSRKISQSKDAGPTIHELEEEIEISPEELLQDETMEEEIPLIQSPVTPTSTSNNQKAASPLPNTNLINEQSQISNESVDFPWDKPDYVGLSSQIDRLTENDEELLNSLQSSTAESNEKIFLNPSSRDTLIGSLVNPLPFTPAPITNKSMSNREKLRNGSKNYVNVTAPQQNAEMQIVDKNDLNNVKIQNDTLGTTKCFRSDLDSHLDNTQSELEQLKDILNGCNTFDTNTVLGTYDNMKDHDAPTRRIAVNNTLPDSFLQIFTHCNNDGNFIQTKDVDGDPLVSGTELTENMIDFNELLDDSLTQDDSSIDILNPTVLTPQLPGTLETPLGVNDSKPPLFPKGI